MTGTLPMPFNNPSTYKGHSGVDFGQPSGMEILASGSGKVNYAGYLNEKAGYGVTVSYDAYPGVEFMYCHQLKDDIRPNAGSRFVLYDYLGPVGSTGHSTGPHLHLEVSSGPGAHTYEGVWKYFDINNWVGKEYNPVTIEENEDEMFIAAFGVNVGGIKAGAVYLVVPSGNGKPTGVLLDGSALRDKPNIPVVHFDEQFSADSVVKAVNF